MQNQHKFTARTRMSDLINEDASLLSSISRFGISLGFGDKTVREACEANNIDCDTFLSVVNFLSEGNVEINETYNNISIESVINYLKNAHTYFLDYKLPSIRTKLLDAVESTAQSSSYKLVFMKFFDEYFDEVRKHMDYEDMNVFTYVENLMTGRETGGFRISQFARRHDQIDATLTELKNIIIKYYPAKGNNHLLNAVLFDIFSCEQDLASHCRVEDYLFVPAVLRLEKEGK